eukprot:TRINITY_DN4688_c0_g1_i3.p1 TRINITY_DN4688_c0_g1~~TRINITY_DN4688_c0_g1_i3.p1  ORF type:complete len:494 (+),score=115.80 TRINITY_DN4688_c0_g1_i3:141-1622(+)
MSIREKDGVCFNACGCEPPKRLSVSEADALLLANRHIYAGYVTIDSAPGIAVFARLGTSTLEAPGHSVRTVSADLQPVRKDEDGEESDSEEEGAIFRTDDLPAGGGNMSGYLRPGRGQGFLDEAELALFREVDAADIFQGGLGDCWLLSAFSALAEFPDALMSLFKQRALSDDGKYEITLYNFVERRWQCITIDDRLPVRVKCCKEPHAAYVRPTADGEIWTCLLEKAFAVMFDNSYATLIGGVPTTAFAALCGVGGESLGYVARAGQTGKDGWVLLRPILDSWRPYEEQNFDWGVWPDGTPGNYPKSSADLFKIMKHWDDNNFIMAVGTNAGSDTQITDQGIVHGHAYTVLGIADNAWGTGARLLQLRNPWGEKEWTGDWSDQSPLWDQYPEARRILNPEASEDGAFWIDMEDFGDNYQGIAVVMKDVGLNYEKVCNPKAIYPRPRNALTGPWPQKTSKLRVRRRKQARAEEASVPVDAKAPRREGVHCSLS